MLVYGILRGTLHYGLLCNQPCYRVVGAPNKEDPVIVLGLSLTSSQEHVTQHSIKEVTMDQLQWVHPH